MIPHRLRTMLFLAVFASAGCTSDSVDPPQTVAPDETAVLTDFAHVVANPVYSELEVKAAALLEAVRGLRAAPTETGLQSARTAWLAARQPWEYSEAFLFGPVEDFQHDPALDDWPVNRVDLDSILAGSAALTMESVRAFPTSLKGFHSLEYLLFGIAGTKTAAQCTERERQYMEALAGNIALVSSELRRSWDPAFPGNFTAQFISAGEGSTVYPSRRNAMLVLVTAMAGICEEVAGGKMEDPLMAMDSTLEESQFSHSSTADFRNNMIGVRNAFRANFLRDGRGLDDYIAAKNLSLSNRVRSLMDAAVAAFDGMDAHYGRAIFTQQSLIRRAQDAITAVQEVLENDVTTFLRQQVAN
jgi:putative iron-regulated protein